MRGVSEYEPQCQNPVLHDGILITACERRESQPWESPPLPQHRHPALPEISPTLALLLQEQSKSFLAVVYHICQPHAGALGA